MSKASIIRRIESRDFLPLCLTVAFALRVAWIIFAIICEVRPISDGAWYFDRAIEIANGQGYSINGEPTVYWPVGYPGFLGMLFSLVEPSLLTVSIANLLLSLGSIYLAYLVAEKLFDSGFVAGITALVLAIHPNHIAYVSLAVSEIFFLFLTMALSALLILPEKRKLLWSIVAGTVFGMGILVKPQIVLLPVLLLASHRLHSNNNKESIARGVIIYLIAAAIVLPWTLRNQRLFGTAVLSNNDGVNLLIGNNPHATGTYLLDSTIAPKSWAWEDEYGQNISARDLALSYLRDHPVEAIARLPRKLWYLYRSDVEGITWNKLASAKGSGITSVIFDLYRVYAQIFYMLFIGALVSLAVMYRRRMKHARHEGLPKLGLWIALYFTAIYLIYFGDPRFHFPVIPWLAMYLGALIEASWEMTHHLRTGR